jgi:crossover junction endodeoxyribonuclease RusA
MTGPKKQSGKVRRNTRAKRHGLGRLQTRLESGSGNTVNPLGTLTTGNRLQAVCLYRETKPPNRLPRTPEAVGNRGRAVDPAGGSGAWPGEVALVVPWPPRSVSPNARAHWQIVRRARRECRQLGMLLALAAVGHAGLRRPSLAPGERIRLDVTLSPPRRGRYDVDNALAALKSTLDGVFDALEWDDAWVDEVLVRRGVMVPGGQVELRLRVVPVD